MSFRLASPSPVVVLARSAAPVSHTGDTNEFTFASVTIPAGRLGPNGVLRITRTWTMPNNANTKTLRGKLGATTFFVLALAAGVVTTTAQHLIQNRASAASQMGTNQDSSSGVGSTASGLVTAAIDTTVDQTLLLTGQLGAAGDTLTLESYLVELLPG